MAEAYGHTGRNKLRLYSALLRLRQTSSAVLTTKSITNHVTRKPINSSRKLFQ